MKQPFSSIKKVLSLAIFLVIASTATSASAGHGHGHGHGRLGPGPVPCASCGSCGWYNGVWTCPGPAPAPCVFSIGLNAVGLGD